MNGPETTNIENFPSAQVAFPGALAVSPHVRTKYPNLARIPLYIIPLPRVNLTCGRLVLVLALDLGNTTACWTTLKGVL